MISKNFVSISGISDKQQLKEIHKTCIEENIKFPIAIGYQVSNKSINQGTKGPRQPRFTELGDLSKETQNYSFIPVIHYYTKNNKTIQKDLERIVKVGVNPNSSLLQFNTLPPSLDVLGKIKSMGFGIIFKVAVSNKQSPQRGYAVWKGDAVEDVSSGRVAPLVKQVYDRRELIDYVMFDPSHGTNLNLDLDKNSLAIKFGKRIFFDLELAPFNLGLVYAGGIKPTNVGTITKSLLSFFPQERISIDIESGVRRDNKFDLDLVRDYLVNYNHSIQK